MYICIKQSEKYLNVPKMYFQQKISCISSRAMFSYFCEDCLYVTEFRFKGSFLKFRYEYQCLLKPRCSESRLGRLTLDSSDFRSASAKG